jgi:ATP-dependent RNA helicase RhlE
LFGQKYKKILFSRALCYICAMSEALSFEDFALNRQLLNAVADKGYSQPTPIQQKAIPAILAGHDVMGIAQTGTGKTAAYVLPLLMKIKYAQGNDPRALVLVPTRELAMQVRDNIRQYSKYTDLRLVVAYGGVGPKTQIEELTSGCDIVVATPGRLWELYLQGHLVLKKLQLFVLDEADRLMDMGFLPQIHRILEVVPRKRQNLLFSATVSELVKKIAGDFLEFPLLIHIEPEQKTAITVSQKIYYVPNSGTKLNLLIFLMRTDVEKSIVFCRSKTVADGVFRSLSRYFGEEEVRVIHGNKGQNARINSITAFREGEVKFLVATDVAARGIDISNVSHVINFDVPIVYEDYIHRIGRTGRASQSGDSITFCTEAEVYHLEKIQKLIRQRIAVEKIPAEVPVEKTPFEEQQQMLREIDLQKRKENPDFKGAFHEKKNMPPPVNRKRSSKNRGRR